MSEVKKSKRTNQFKIKCFECNAIMDSDHRSKHNKRFQLNLLKKRKIVIGGVKRSKESFHNIVSIAISFEE